MALFEQSCKTLFYLERLFESLSDYLWANARNCFNEPYLIMY